MRYLTLTLTLLVMMTHTVLSQTPEYTMDYDGLSRTYLLYVPKSYTGEEAVPLVFALHGGGGDAAGMEKLTLSRLNTLAEEHNFIVVYPDGVGKYWNDGRIIQTKRTSTADDVGFISALIDELSAHYNIDSDRIFSTGMSNGGMMSYRLACDLSDRLAGVAPVAAILSVDLSKNCTPSQSTHILMILGTDDPLMPYQSGMVGILGIERGIVLSADETLAFWADRFNCPADVSEIERPNSAILDGTRVTEVSYPSCDDGVRVNLITIHGGGHTWAGGWQYLNRFIIGKTSKDIDASAVIWDFFSTIDKSG